MLFGDFWGDVLRSLGDFITKTSGHPGCGPIGKYKMIPTYQCDQIGRNFAIWAKFLALGELFF
jgi:hypothetical protein